MKNRLSVIYYTTLVVLFLLSFHVEYLNITLLEFVFLAILPTSIIVLTTVFATLLLLIGSSGTSLIILLILSLI